MACHQRAASSAHPLHPLMGFRRRKAPRPKGKTPDRHILFPRQPPGRMARSRCPDPAKVEQCIPHRLSPRVLGDGKSRLRGRFGCTEGRLVQLLQDLIGSHPTLATFMAFVVATSAFFNLNSRVGFCGFYLMHPGRAWSCAPRMKVRCATAHWRYPSPDFVTRRSTAGHAMRLGSPTWLP